MTMTAQEVEPPSGSADAGGAQLTLVSMRTADTSWDALEERLVRWAYAPEALRDEGFEPPKASVIAAARHFLAQLRQHIAERPDEQDLLAFSRVSPDGDGGLAFERNRGDQSLIVEFTPDGAEALIFQGGNLVHRRSL
jgi:hypothetical protein